MPSKLEVAKDVLQVSVESGSERVGRIASLITGVVAEVSREVGEWASDIFEVIEAAKKAPGRAQKTTKKTGASAKRA